MLHYTTHGAPEHPAYCFLHGFMGSAADWEPIIAGLTEAAFCVAVDLPGHGASTDIPPWTYSMEGVTQALADVLDDAGVEECVLVGYSMGGRVALYYTLYHGDRIRRLVLESASPGLRSEEERAHRRSVDADRAEAIQEDFEAFLENWYRMPLFASLERRDLVESMVEQRRHNDPTLLARVLDGLGTGAQPSLWDDLESLDVPTLVLTGSRDEKYVTVAGEIASRNPAVRPVVVPDAGHNVHAERPQAYLSHVVDFVALH